MENIIDRTGHLRPDKNGAYSFLITKLDGRMIYKEFKKKTPFLNAIKKRTNVKQLIIDIR